METQRSAEKEFEIEVINALYDFADKVFYKSQTKLADGKTDTGQLLQSGALNKYVNYVEIVYSAPYADVVHFGRQPGSMPPPQALEKWIRRKLKLRNPQQVRSVSFAIAKSIKERGIQMYPYLQDAYDETINEYNQM